MTMTQLADGLYWLALMLALVAFAMTVQAVLAWSRNCIGLMPPRKVLMLWWMGVAATVVALIITAVTVLLLTVGVWARAADGKWGAACLLAVTTAYVVLTTRTALLDAWRDTTLRKVIRLPVMRSQSDTWNGKRIWTVNMDSVPSQREQAFILDALSQVSPERWVLEMETYSFTFPDGFAGHDEREVVNVRETLRQAEARAERLAS